MYEGSAYWEAPLGDRHALVLAPWAERSEETQDGWRAETAIGVKRAVVREAETVVAMQASAVWVTTPPDACGEGGAEARVLAGRTLGGRSFANVEVAARALEGGCGGQRLDVTLGHRPAEHWLGMAQLFVDAPIDGRETIRGQVSLVAFGANDRGIQIGIRARLDGEDAEPALIIGLWRRPLG